MVFDAVDDGLGHGIGGLGWPRDGNRLAGAGEKVGAGSDWINQHQPIRIVQFQAVALGEAVQAAFVPA